MGEVAGSRGLKPIQTTRDVEGPTSHGEAGQPLSPMARLFHEPGSNVYIIGIFGSKTKIYPEVAKSIMVEGVLKHPRFSSLQVLDKEDGLIKWVPTKVNLDDHVVVAEVPPNLESPDQFVEDYIFDLTKTIHTVDRSKPMWDLHLLDVKTSDGCEGVFVYRVHHSIGDGMSIMSLLLACSRKVSDPEALPTIPAVKKSSPKFSFWAVLQMLWNTIVGTLLFVATALFLTDTKTPLKGDTGIEKNPRRVLTRMVSLEDVKLVKKAMNITINDVVLGVSQAGLSRYLNRRYGEIKNDKGPIDEEKNYLPENIRLRAIFYMNIRPSAGLKALSDMMEKGSQARWGNQIGYVLLPFTIGLQADPLDYVRKAKAVIDRKKVSLEVICSCYITKALIWIFGSKVAGFFNYKVFANTTLWFSNVPGTEEEIAFCGHKLAYFAPTCYGQPNSLMIHVISYTDKILFVISAEETIIPNPHQLCDDLEDSLKLIKSAVLAKQHIKGD